MHKAFLTQCPPSNTDCLVLRVPVREQRSTGSAALHNFRPILAHHNFIPLTAQGSPQGRQLGGPVAGGEGEQVEAQHGGEQQHPVGRQEEVAREGEGRADAQRGADHGEEGEERSDAVHQRAGVGVEEEAQGHRQHHHLQDGLGHGQHVHRKGGAQQEGRQRRGEGDGGEGAEAGNHDAERHVSVREKGRVAGQLGAGDTGDEEEAGGEGGRDAKCSADDGGDDGLEKLLQSDAEESGVGSGRVGE